MEFKDAKMDNKYKGKGTRKCRLCGTARGLIRAHKLYICRRCFRDSAKSIGFTKYG